MPYKIVTDSAYIPYTSDGECHFLVLESDDFKNESKFIYILIDDITSIDIVTYTNVNEIRLYVSARPTYVVLHEDQRELLFNIINNHITESDTDESCSESEAK